MKNLHRGYNSIEAKIKNGFPVIFWFKPCKAEPDVGLMQDYIDDWFITTTTGKPCTFIKPTKNDEDRLIQEAFESCENDSD